MSAFSSRHKRKWESKTEEERLAEFNPTVLSPSELEKAETRDKQWRAIARANVPAQFHLVPLKESDGPAISEQFVATDFKKPASKIKRSITADLWRLESEEKKVLGSVLSRQLWIRVVDACRLGGLDEAACRSEACPDHTTFPDYALFWSTAESKSDVDLFVPFTSFIARLALNWNHLMAKRKRELIHACAQTQARLLTGKPAAYAKTRKESTDEDWHASDRSQESTHAGGQTEHGLYQPSAKKIKQQNSIENAQKFAEFMKNKKAEIPEERDKENDSE